MAETPPTATSAPARHTYAIRAGDELRFIAARNGVSLASLVALNGIPDPDRVAVGQELAIPAAGASSVVGRTISALVTGYANGADGGAVGSTTASGTRTHWGTVAADLRAYPFGTKLVIDGFDGVVFVVEDTGSGVHGDIFDVWFPDVPSAVHFGAQRRQVTILPPGG